ncbi:EamA family transporter [Kineococcus sp. SYSU DK006]|uniref:EamA family transporter n=1 Tax=Kineococcus sp. SYSU DK006 TaxID=3383127 RepID=UPI003D7D71B4
MTIVTDDSSRRLASGLGFAVLSAASFGLSGSLARGLLDGGWSPGAVVLVRIGLAAAVLALPAALALRGRWGALRRNTGLVAVYGLLAVGAAQFCYFSAVARMPVGPALLIEYTAPAAVVGWLWLRHGQRPGRLTAAGAALAALGLVLVLDLLTGTRLDTGGVLWALGAMVGATTYFVLSAEEGTGLPPLALAGGGLLVAALALGLLGLAGVLPLSAGTAPAVYAGRAVPWWVPLLGLGLVTAAVAYVAGIAAGRRLGSRLASFVALLEVVAGVAGAWLLLGELPRQVQLLGGVLVVAGVVVVKLGEPRPAPAALPQPSPAA